MCGILGQIRFDGEASSVPNLELIKHRGPDGNGEWTNSSGKVYFGHTRLAILEPTPAGAQPMMDASEQFTITFNGEIYDHLQLRELLPAIKWRGTSDTETLLQLLSHKGLSALKLLKGMFAFALYNSNDQTVTLVRDRLGIKPLWVKKEDNNISFSSEVRVLIEDTNAELTREALSEYIAFGRMPAQGEVFKSIESIKPGTWLKISKDGIVEEESWWLNKESVTEDKAVEGEKRPQIVKRLVTKAVEEHLISDVGVGAFLSGGIDSSIITLIAGKALGKRLKTFTVGFPQGDYDERTIARRVAKKAGSEHVELEVTEDDCLVSVMEAVDKLDLPSVDAINTYIVSKAVTETGLKVALSGLGGDELFGGYPSFKNIPLLKQLQNFPPAISQQVIKSLPASFKEKLSGTKDFSTESLTVTRRRFTSIDKLQSLGLEDGIPSIIETPTGLDTMGRISWSEMQGYMIPMLLRDSDQMSMAVGLEIRVPFLDHQLVEAILSMPQKAKKGKLIKPLLIEAFADVLPAEVYNRPKQGFSLPMKEWLNGPLKSFTVDGIEAVAEITGLREPTIQKDKFFADSLHWTRVWQWSVLGHWLVKQNIGIAATEVYS